MQGCKVLAICLGLCTLSGCLAFGVPYTSDPNKKLAYAAQLINEDRPLPAERLIVEALETFKANGDKNGIAEAYRLYGLVLLIQRYVFYQRFGFRDKTVTFDNRYAKSIEYFENAKDFYIEHKDNAKLRIIYLNMAFTYKLMNNRKAACAAFDQSLESYRESLKDDPNTKVNLPTIYKDFPEFVDVARKENSCGVSFDSYNKLLLEVKSNVSVSISDLDKERITRAIITKIKQKAPNRFGEIISQASDPTTLHVVITLTTYGEGSAVPRLMMPGLERIYIEAEVALENYASKAQLSKHEVTMTGGSMGIHGRNTTLADAEAGFVEAVAANLLYHIQASSSSPTTASDSPSNQSAP